MKILQKNKKHKIVTFTGFSGKTMDKLGNNTNLQLNFETILI